MATKQKKKVDPLKQREKRAKIAAVGGFVVLIIVGAIEVPTIMKATKSTPPPASAATTTPSTSALPDVADGMSSTADTVSSTSGLADTDQAPPAAAGQLVSFSVFPTKNPFTPQAGVVATSTAPAATDASSGGAQSKPKTPSTATPSTTTPSMSVVPSAGSSSSSTATQGPLASISVNGVVSRVAVDDTFPSGAPVFQLVSAGSKTARIGIVGGSLSSGGATVELVRGQTVTLENTNDGKQYKLTLLATS